MMDVVYRVEVGDLECVDRGYVERVEYSEERVGKESLGFDG